MRPDLARHLHATGMDEAALTDPATDHSIRMLESMLNIVEAAHREERIDPAATQRVLKLIIFGATGSPAEVEQRQRMHQAMVEHLTVCSTPQRAPWSGL